MRPFVLAVIVSIASEFSLSNAHALPVPTSLAGRAKRPSLLLRLRGGDLNLLRDYAKLCEFYHVKPHPSVLFALRWKLGHIHPSRRDGSTRAFRDHDLLPLTDLLLQPGASHVTSLSFRGCRLRGSGALMLARLIALSPNLRSVDLTGNKLGPEAGALFADALAHSRSLVELRLKGCRLRQAGTDALALALATSLPHESAPLRVLDLSNNQIGWRSKAGIERVNARRAQPITIELAGNLVLAETLNVITHGGGTIAAVVGSGMLLRLVMHAPVPLRLACIVYATTLIICYTSSTLFHSSFMLGKVRHVFHILDQCAIYLLIAGSYTPFMTVLFHPHKPLWSTWLLVFMWSLCAIGILIELLYHHARGSMPWIKYTSLGLYAGMGWCAAFPPLFRDMRAAMSPRALRLLVGGGLTYTLGIPAFVRNKHLDHVIWHAFVLGGSALQYLSLYLCVEDAMVGTL